MKKEYKTPVVKTIALSTEEGVLQVGSPQGGLDTGAGLGDRVPDGGQENGYSNRRGIWGNTEW